MQRRKFLANCLAIMLASTLSTAAVAQSGLPLSGAITKITSSEGTITVGDQIYKIKPNVRVVDSKGRPMSRLKPNELKKGTYIEFKANREEPLRRITTISVPKP